MKLLRRIALGTTLLGVSAAPLLSTLLGASAATLSTFAALPSAEASVLRIAVNRQNQGKVGLNVSFRFEAPSAQRKQRLFRVDMQMPAAQPKLAHFSSAVLVLPNARVPLGLKAKSGILTGWFSLPDKLRDDAKIEIHTQSDGFPVEVIYDVDVGSFR